MTATSHLNSATTGHSEMEKYQEREKMANDGVADGGIVAVNPKPHKGLTSKIIDFVERMIVKFMHDSSQPHHYLSGNFAPVTEETPPTKSLTVIGQLPVSSLYTRVVIFFLRTSVFHFCEL